MALKVFDRKPKRGDKKTAIEKQKEKQKAIAQSVSVEERRFEELKKNNNEQEEKGKKVESVTETRKKELDVIEKQIEEKKQELAREQENIQNEKVKGIEEMEKISEDINKMDKERVMMATGKDKADAEKAKAQKEIEQELKEAELILEKKIKEVVDLKTEEKNISEAIRQKKDEAIKISDENTVLLSKKIELEEMLDILRDEQAKTESKLVQKKKIEQELLVVQEALKDLRRELSGINEIRQRKMADLDKREKELNTTEGVLKTKQETLEQKKLTVDRLAKTLQKHFDKHNIPINIEI